MRRADRLFQIVQILRREKYVTAAGLAQELEVSLRTVYRDVADLQRSGVPVEGEAGVGYTLQRGFDLPPLMFNEDELEALVLGMRMVISWGDPEIARSARDVQAKVESILPEPIRGRFGEAHLYAHDFFIDPRVAFGLSDLRRAMRSKHKVKLHYEDAESNKTERTVWPLSLSFWGRSWTLMGWCELREDFRHFRLNRLQALEESSERFDDEPGRTLEDFLARMRERH